MKKFFAWTLGIFCMPVIITVFFVLYLLLAFEFFAFNVYRHIVADKFLFRHGWNARKNYLIATRVDFATFCELRHGR